MALFQAGSEIPVGTQDATLSVPAETWYRRALLQALFLLADPQNWDNLQGTVSVDECASLAVKMIEEMVWE